jgi:hypothetical protein
MYGEVLRGELSAALRAGRLDGTMTRTSRFASLWNRAVTGAAPAPDRTVALRVVARFEMPDADQFRVVAEAAGLTVPIVTHSSIEAITEPAVRKFGAVKGGPIACLPHRLLGVQSLVEVQPSARPPWHSAGTASVHRTRRSPA